MQRHIFATLPPAQAALEREEQQIREIFLLGIIVNYLLWGIQIIQSFRYYKSYHKTDGAVLKAAVGLLFITEVVQSICGTDSVWLILVGGSGAVPSVGWGGNAVPFMDALPASIVQCFYAQTIWTLLKAPYKYIYTGVVVTLSCLQLTAGLGCSIFMYSINITLPEFGRIKTWVCIWLFTSAATDLIITTLMTWKLSNIRTGIKNTDDIISKLIQLIVETGLATTVVQIVGIVVYLIWPLKLYHIAIALIGSKVYSNSILALLNSRPQRDANPKWDSRQADSIHIRTTRTVDVSSDYELDEQRAGSGKVASSPYVYQTRT